jgi:hypothetical protein
LRAAGGSNNAWVVINGTGNNLLSGKGRTDENFGDPDAVRTRGVSRGGVDSKIGDNCKPLRCATQIG